MGPGKAAYRILGGGLGKVADIFALLKGYQAKGEMDQGQALAKMTVEQRMREADPMYQQKLQQEKEAFPVDIAYKKALAANVGGRESYNDFVLGLVKKGVAEKRAKEGRELTFDEELDIMEKLNKAQYQSRSKPGILESLQGENTELGNEGVDEYGFKIGEQRKDKSGMLRTYMGNNQWQ